MNVTLSQGTSTEAVDDEMRDVAARARRAQAYVRELSASAKHRGLIAMANALRAASEAVLAANREDVAVARGKDLAQAFIDRLGLTPSHIEAMAQSIEAIAALGDPIGKCLAVWTRPNGLVIEKVVTPIGVIGIIFESRPNVTADAGALCLAAGNAAILRSGTDSLGSARAIHRAMVEGLRTAGIEPDIIQLIQTPDRAAVGALLAGLYGAVDVIVPRGGKSLVERVMKEARVPVFSHLEGVCHIYIDPAADLAMAKNIVLNAKLRRPEVCGAAETLLIDQAAAPTHLQPLVAALIEAGCEVRGDEAVCVVDQRVQRASEADWYAEYLAPIIAVKIVADIEAAVAHIGRYGSSHTEAIITNDDKRAEYFLSHVDSAIVLHNASTQFADGGEFGMGAEIGIATGRLHARGPVGVEQLTSFNYRVHGSGQIRP